ncbi:uncharacterized protein LOC141856213 [Brevipalpus obovatus]|uniref:uncharacterized protein LOC141856213 n=1 Tax=Brevipalpus obovatus TaxID=246614 RepID=UPI003D9F525F
MNLSLAIFWILLCTLLWCDFSSGQSQRKPRPRKKPRPDYRKKFHCLVCLSDFGTKKINFQDTCINPAVNVTDAEFKWLVVCPSDTTTCAYEVHTINGVFTAIERRCASSCLPNCYTERYGTEKTVCTYCCPKSIKPEDFNEETVYEAICESALNNGHLSSLSTKIWFVYAMIIFIGNHLFG